MLFGLLKQVAYDSDVHTPRGARHLLITIISLQHPDAEWQQILY